MKKTVNWFKPDPIPIVYLLIVPRWFLCWSSSLFVRLWFLMWRLFGHYVCLGRSVLRDCAIPWVYSLISFYIVDRS